MCARKDRRIIYYVGNMDDSRSKYAAPPFKTTKEIHAFYKV